jgi:hypothetical protein
MAAMAWLECLLALLFLAAAGGVIPFCRRISEWDRMKQEANEQERLRKVRAIR